MVLFGKNGREIKKLENGSQMDVWKNGMSQ
jgi:hypothetical protein